MRLIGIVAVVGFLAACSTPQRHAAPCAKDYAALKTREIAVIDAGMVIEDKLQSEADLAKLSISERKLVEDADVLLESRQRIADSKDVAIIDRARAILKNEGLWDRRDDRICDATDTRFSLYCALYRASREIVGEYQHRRTALQEVRFALEDATRGRDYAHRLRDFNNDPRTKLSDVYAVLAVARARLIKRLEDQRLCRL